MSWRVELGDCVEVLRGLPDASIDAVVCDPPYGLEFMGKTWDKLGGDGRQIGDSTFKKGDARHGSVRYGGAAYGQDAAQAGRVMQEWHEAWAREVLRVLKPGGHLLAFGGTRTYHRLATGVEDAGFEIRDTIAWMYGSGFPKSLDVSKAIDKAAGAERTEATGVKPGHEGFIDRTDAHSAGGRSDGWERDWRSDPEAVRRSHMTFAPATPEAEQWEGWGTALKPAHEPIVVARKPLAGTVAGNVLAHGTGALNIDGCRIAFAGEVDEQESKAKNRHGDFGTEHGGNAVYGDYTRDEPRGNYDPPGRWPANVVLDDAAGTTLDEQTGERAPGNHPARRRGIGFTENAGGRNSGTDGERRATEAGGASRFFYCAKAATGERSAGLDEGRNVHPTVKPIDLMRWLVRLVTPPGGTVLDPFTGSGTTGCAAVLEGFDFIGVEREPDYAAIAEARIAWWADQPAGITVDDAVAGGIARRKVADAGQATLDLFGGAA